MPNQLGFMGKEGEKSNVLPAHDAGSVPVKQDNFQIEHEWLAMFVVIFFVIFLVINCR